MYSGSCRRRTGATGDDDNALQVGASQFKVSLDNLLTAHQSLRWASENILVAVSGNADGTSGVKEAADATMREEIEKAAHVFFTSSPKQREFWLGRGKASLAELRSRYGGPKACIWGCDAHQLERVGKPAEDRHCWIKGTPSFDSLRQAVIDPERAYVGPQPPTTASSSQTIDAIVVDGASWLGTPRICLNSGLVAVIGARGSGKTALVDMIAAGCDAYATSQRPSFLARASEHLEGARVTVHWRSGDPTGRPLEMPVNASFDAYPRARYLSQQFVEELCSIEGMPTLIDEIERVIFEAHPAADRDGAVRFDELLELRARQYRDDRRQEELALAELSDEIGIELDKSRQVSSLAAQIVEKGKLLAGYERDRKTLLPKVPSKASERLQELVAAFDAAQGHLRAWVNRQQALAGLASEVQNLRKNHAPATLRALKERYRKGGLDDEAWKRFLLDYTGDVDSAVDAQVKDTERHIYAWKGTPPTAPFDASTGTFLDPAADPTTSPLALLAAEIARLEGVVATDRDTAKRLTAIGKKITEESAALERLKEKLEDYKGARQRAEEMVTRREDCYKRVFIAILAEERVLRDLYAPLMERLKTQGGSLSKLSFSVSRVADVDAWAKRGEDTLFDLRGGPFKGIGSLAKEAKARLERAWTTGDADAVAKAMSSFRATFQDALLERAPYAKTDQVNYRPWARRFAQWLYSTDHISIEYGIRYDGIDIQKLSPGTRGIVLVLLYLALDEADDRPLVIDQPEENLDPQSIYDELVPLFQGAKQRRQVIMVTHNANLVVNADADQIIVAHVGTHDSPGLPPIRYEAGGLEEQRIRTLVCDILEGGERAFRDRASGSE